MSTDFKEGNNKFNQRLLCYASKIFRAKKKIDFNKRIDFEKNLDKYYDLKAKIYSFDVFDTILTRNFGNSSNLFKILQEKLKHSNLEIPEDFRNNFAHWRLNAEAQAKQKFYKEGNSLEDIYKTILSKYSLPLDIRTKIMEMEIKLEMEAINPVTKIVELIKYLHKNDAKVIFISDMYLPKEVIQEMLERLEVYHPEDELYVSNTFRKTKSSGTLYKYILEKTGCRPQDMIHMGDNYHSDVVAAKELNIQSLHFKKSQYNRYEDILKEEAKGLSKDLQDDFESLAESARLARLAESTEASEEDELYNLGVNVAGPIFYFFTKWLLQKAQKENIKRLYFLARDGQIIYEIAKDLKKQLKLDIDLRYIYASRQSTFLPATTEITEEVLRWMLLSVPYLSLRIIANRIHFDVDELVEEFSKVHGKKIGADQHLLEYEIKFLERFIRNPIFSKKILTIAAKKREIILKYFEQEKLLDDENYAFVDLGWRCSIQDSIVQILRCSDKKRTKPFRGYYFGVVTKKGKFIFNNLKDGFYFAPDHPINHVCPTSWRAMQVMEIFSTGDHGITMDYELKDEGVVPVLKEPHNDDAYKWGLINLRLGIFKFINNVSLENIKKSCEGNQKEVWKVITRFYETLICFPTKKEAEAIGEYLFKSDQAETYAHQYAPKFKFLSALKYAFVNNRKRNSITTWFLASYRRSRFLSKLVLKILMSRPVVRLKNIIHRVISGIKSMGSKRLKIAVVMQRFPCLSETFILNQIIGLIDLGHKVDIFAYEKPQVNEKFHDSINDYRLLERTCYIKSIPKNGKINRICLFITILFTKAWRHLDVFLRCLDLRKFGVYYSVNNLFLTAPFLKKSYDIVHCHFGPVGNELNKIMPFLPKAKLVVTFHGYDANRTPKEQGADVYKNLFAGDNHFTANTNFTKNLLIELGADDLSVDILPVGVKFEKIKYSVRELPIDDPIQFLTVGRLVEKKGHVYAIKALAQVVKKYPNVVYAIAGDGPLREDLQNLVKELSIENHVIFLGAVKENEVASLYTKSHIFILPSVTAQDGDREGQALVLQEAQASGMPVLSTIHNGIPDGVLDKQSGFLAPEKDADALAERMIYLIENSDQWKEMGRIGRQFVGGKYNIGWLNEQLEGIFYQVRKK
jgi:colanic acid/amylovoran biosynthesis glycosyltransferase